MSDFVAWFAKAEAMPPRDLLISAGLAAVLALAGCGEPNLPYYTITCYPDGPSKPPRVYDRINKRDFYLGKQGTSIYAPSRNESVLPVVEYSPGVQCTAEMVP